MFRLGIAIGLSLTMVIGRTPAEGATSAELQRLAAGKKYVEVWNACRTIDPEDAEVPKNFEDREGRATALMACGTAAEMLGHLDEAWRFYSAVRPFRDDAWLTASLGDVKAERARRAAKDRRHGGIAAYCDYREATEYYGRIVDGKIEAPSELTSELTAKLSELVAEAYKLKKFLQANPDPAEIRDWVENKRDPFKCGLAGTNEKDIGPSSFAVLIRFVNNSSALLPEAKLQIESLARALRDAAEAHVTLVGFASSSGSAEYNLELSKRRAAAVREALKDPDLMRRVSIKGLGATRIVTDPEGNEDADMSRRVELE